jgi:asparagine synthase (glutamine-hydrolysing)
LFEQEIKYRRCIKRTMGALSLIIFSDNHKFINKDFSTSFSKLKNRGRDETTYNVDSTMSLKDVRPEILRANLTRSEIGAYRQYHFVSSCHRMAVNDLTPDASQPFEDPIPHKIGEYKDLRTRPIRKLMCTGEIYNYNQLCEQESFGDKDLQSKSDVEVILPMYIKYGLARTLEMIRGEYSFTLTENTKTYRLKDVNAFVVRDPLGHRPLYMLKAHDRSFYMFVSELKAIPRVYFNREDYTITEVPPGTYWSFNRSIANSGVSIANGSVTNANDEFVRYHDWNNYRELSSCRINEINPTVLSSTYMMIENRLKTSVSSMLSYTRPVGVLLDGEFDSSIVLSAAVEHLKRNGHNFNICPIYAFTIGEPTSKHVLAAQNCVDFLEKKYNVVIHHHIVDIKDNDLLVKAVEEVISTIELYDMKTVSKSVSFGLMFKYVMQHTPVRIILTGKGLNELCGYKRIVSGTDDATFQRKSIRMIKHLSKYDLACFDKIGGAYGIELRHPLLNVDFLKGILDIHPKLKRPEIFKVGEERIEKYIIRKAFDKGYLPSGVLWSRSSDNAHDTHFKKTILEHCERLYNEDTFFKFVNEHSGIEIKDKMSMHYLKTFKRFYPRMTGIIPGAWERLLE